MRNKPQYLHNYHRRNRLRLCPYIHWIPELLYPEQTYSYHQVFQYAQTFFQVYRHQIFPYYNHRLKVRACYFYHRYHQETNCIE